jgi:Tol biopolymer transport system component
VQGMGMAVPQWSADGRDLYFNLSRKGAANIWKMEGPGGALKQVTNYPSGLIASFAWSQDGKTLYVARGTRSNDVVLLKASK